MMRLKGLTTRDEISEREYKIELDFQTIAIQDLNNAANAVDLLVRDNIIDTKKARDVMKMSDIDDRMEAEDAVRKEQLALLTFFFSVDTIAARERVMNRLALLHSVLSV